METFAKDFISLLQYLLPGFVAAWVFYGLTSFLKPSQFERVVQALIFTIFIQALVFIVENILLLIGNKWKLLSWTTQSELIWSYVLAIILGLFFSYFANNDKIHKKLRDWNVTRESSYPSGWFGVFLNNVTFVVLHFEDERRLYGWPIEWPSEPEKGHFVIEQASWLDEENEENKENKERQIPITGVKSIMVNVKDVKWVEFMEKTWEKENA